MNVSERGGAIGGLLATIGFIVVVMAILFAVCVSTTGASQHSLAPVAAYHDGQECERQSDCDSQSYDQWRNEDRNRNRNRNRGAFSPGPFDRSPVDAFNNMCMPGATCNYGPTTTTTTGQVR